MINGTATYTAAEIREFGYNGTLATFNKCDELEKQGYRFIPGNNPLMNRTKKWSGFDVIRVAQTNHRRSGLCKQTLWAVK